MIYIYGAVCVSMILFNIIYNISLKRSEPHLENRCRKLKKQLDAQLARIQEHERVEEAYLHQLQQRLRRMQELIAFRCVLGEAAEQQPTLVKEYLDQIQPGILSLANYYKGKEPMQAGYFAYFLAGDSTMQQMHGDALPEALLDYVKKENLYCRVNALEALCHFANVEYVVKAVGLQDDGKILIHEKIITETLLSFRGEHHALIDRLWETMPDFSLHTQLAILNYIRFQTGDYREKMFSVMQDQKADQELRFAAIRYFGKYSYEPALEPLLSFAQEKDPARWEFAVIAVSALAGYPGERVLEVLKEALHSENWYIRYSAAQSLEAHQVEYSDLIDIMMGNDRYAREMMTYRLESRKLQKEGDRL